MMQRFVSKIGPPDHQTLCWPWLGHITQEGYGRFSINGVTRAPAHRIAYELFVGHIPAGLVIDHLCHSHDPKCPAGSVCLHRRCVNPLHLEPVSLRENALRGQSFAARNAMKTHCVNGHLYDEVNTYIRADRTGRDCRACDRERFRRSAEARRDAIDEQDRIEEGTA